MSVPGQLNGTIQKHWEATEQESAEPVPLVGILLVCRGAPRCNATRMVD